MGFKFGFTHKNSFAKSQANLHKFFDAHFQACLYAGIKISSAYFSENNSEKYECEIGEQDGLQAGDDLIIMRFLLERIAKDFGIELKGNFSDR